MSRRLENKVALITGASRGIGRAIALRLAELGAKIVLNYVRNEEAAARTALELSKYKVEVFPFQANVGDPEAIDLLVKAAAERFGTIDILVHNAALGAFKPVHQLRMNQWDLSLDINAKAFLLLTQKVLPFMEKKGAGTVLAISSLGARQFIPNYGAIGVSKAALETLVKYLGVELAPKGIRVNCVSGGPVDTDALKSFPDYENLKKEVIACTPVKKIAEPDDLARVAAFLALPDSSWIVGQTLIADGGLSLT